MRFLATRRWLLLALAVVAMAIACYYLGRWQFHRLAETKTYNAMVERNLHAPAAPVQAVMHRGGDLNPNEEWRRVQAVGTFDPRRSVIVRYQTRRGVPGVDVLTPLRTPAGAAILVDRGWVQANNAAVKPKVPPPPSGRVHMVGWARANGTGDSTLVVDRSTRAISSTSIAKVLPYPVYGGFVDLASLTPKPAHPLVHAEMPSLGDGPHFFYGVQWWFFGVLAIGGFIYLAYDEKKRPRADLDEQQAAASQRPEHAAVDGQHHAGHEARGG